MFRASELVEQMNLLFEDNGIKQVVKDESKFASFLGYLAALVPGLGRERFMTRFSTIMANTLYWGTSYHTRTAVSRLVTMCHEYTHWKDFQRVGYLRCWLMYALPQGLAVFGFLGFFDPWLFLFFLFILPWPSPGRAWMELRGYSTNMWVKHQLGYTVNEKSVEHYCDYFTTGLYYWMFPFKGYIKRRLLENLEAIKADKLDIHSIEDLSKVFSK